MCTPIAALLFSLSLMQGFSTKPLDLQDSRFRYSLQKGTARSSLPTLLVQLGDRTIQRIPLTGPAAQEPATEIVLKDVNFDGQADLMITSNRGIVNNLYKYWLYDQSTKRFVLSAAASQRLGGYEITFDPAKKEITTANRSGCCEHQWDTYRFVGKQVKRIRTRIQKGA